MRIATAARLFLGSLFLAVGAGAQTAAVPDAGMLDVRRFAPDWDAVCAGGTDLGQGCARIRARRVEDAAAAPWRAIGRVNFASTRLRGHCTGTLVAERLVATAAHCLYNRARKSWIPAESLVFAAGYQRGGSVAMSTVARYVLDPALDPAGRDFTAAPWQDWALLVLDAPIGRETGWLAPRVLSAETPDAQDLIFAGYASLSEHVLSVAEECGAASLAVDGALLVQHCPVMTGDSGGPVLATADGETVLVGVLSALLGNGADVVSGAVPVATFAEALRREGADVADTAPPAPHQ